MTPGRDQHAAGIALMSAAVLMFSLNDVLGKWLVATYSVAQVLALRSVAALAVLWVLMRREPLAHLIRPQRPWLQAGRVLCGTAEVGAFYWAVGLLPLADTMAFWMATPIFVALVSAWLLAERLSRARMAAIGLGFAGVLLALGAGFEGQGWLAPLIAVAGTLFYTGYLTITRALRGTPATVLAVYQMAGALLVGLAMLPWGWVPVRAADAALLLLLGVVGVLAHLCVTRSLALAPAAVVVPWQYAMILWGILFGWIFFAEVPEPAMLAGVAVIVGAGLWLTRMDLKR